MPLESAAMRSPFLGAVVAPLLVGLALTSCAGTPTQDVAAPEGAAPDFNAMTIDGARVSGESLLGHVTIVDFWAVF